MFDCVEYGFFGDFVVGYAVFLPFRKLQNLLKMPAYGFAFAVRVGCEINFGILPDRRLKFFDDLLFYFVPI